MTFDTRADSFRGALVALTLGASLLTFSPDATAQVKPPPAQPRGAKPPPPPADPNKPTPAQVEKATGAFKEGRKLFDQKKFALALERFRASYDIVQSPNSRLYVARCLVETGASKEAYREFEKVISEADERAKTEPQKYGPTRDTAKTELDEVAAKIGLITVNVINATDATRVKIGGAVTPKDDLGKPMPVDPGAIEVNVETPNQAPINKTVNVEKGKPEVVDIDAAPPVKVDPVVPPPPESGGKPPYLPIAIGTGVGAVVGFGLFAVTGALTLSTNSELENDAGCNPETKNCTGAAGYDDAKIDELQDSGGTTQTVANIGLTVGAVCAAASATFFILYAVDGDEGPGDEPAAARVRFQAGPTYLGVAGEF